MTRQVCLAVTLFLLLLFGAQAAAAPLAGVVERVYDGDTVRVAGVGMVRLLGIDAPEREASGRDDYYRRRGVSAVTLRQTAADARVFVVLHAAGERVTLRVEAETEARDRHGRLLAYLYLPDGRLLNQMLVEAGLAAVYRRFEFSMKQQFIAAEKRARRKATGLWRR